MLRGHFWLLCLHWGSAGAWMPSKWWMAYVIFVSTKPLFRRDAVGATIYSVILGGVLLKISAKKHTIILYNKSLGSVCVIHMYCCIDVVAYWSILNRVMTRWIVMGLNWDSWLWPSPVFGAESLQRDDLKIVMTRRCSVASVQEQHSNSLRAPSTDP